MLAGQRSSKDNLTEQARHHRGIGRFFGEAEILLPVRNASMLGTPDYPSEICSLQNSFCLSRLRRATHSSRIARATAKVRNVSDGEPHRSRTNSPRPLSWQQRQPRPLPVSATFRRFSRSGQSLQLETRRRGGANSTRGLRPNVFSYQFSRFFG